MVSKKVSKSQTYFAEVSNFTQVLTIRDCHSDKISGLFGWKLSSLTFWNCHLWNKSAKICAPSARSISVSDFLGGNYSVNRQIIITFGEKINNICAFGPFSPLPIKNPTFLIEIIQFTTQKSPFLEQNSKIFVPLVRLPHLQLEIRLYR